RKGSWRHRTRPAPPRQRAAPGIAGRAGRDPVLLLTLVVLLAVDAAALAGLHAALDALLLIEVAADVGLQALRRRRVRIAGRGIVLCAIDVLIGARLLAIELLLLLRADPAVLEIARFRAIDDLLLALETAGFPRVELAGLQALLDPPLLIDVALHVALCGGLCERRTAGQQAEQREKRSALHLHWTLSL